MVMSSTVLCVTQQRVRIDATWILRIQGFVAERTKHTTPWHRRHSTNGADTSAQRVK